MILPHNIWVGTSIENRQTLEQRSPILAQIPAHVRFWSAEPLLEDLGNMGQFLQDIHWVICGGESGANSRPCHLEWLQSIVQQCQAFQKNVFVKQVGANAYFQQQQFNTRDHKGGDVSEFPLQIQVREFPNLFVIKSKTLDFLAQTEGTVNKIIRG